MQTEKINDSEMLVTKDAVVAEPTKNTYSIDFLKKQELDILKQMNDFVEQRQKELEEVRSLIGEADKLGLKTQEVIQAEKVVVEDGKLENAVIK